LKARAKGGRPTVECCDPRAAEKTHPWGQSPFARLPMPVLRVLRWGVGCPLGPAPSEYLHFETEATNGGASAMPRLRENYPGP